MAGKIKNDIKRASVVRSHVKGDEHNNNRIHFDIMMSRFSSALEKLRMFKLKRLSAPLVQKIDKTNEEKCETEKV